jgi:telomerase reverse transcriptase
VIWKAFQGKLKYNRAQHVLCNGLERGLAGADDSFILPGIFQRHPNETLTAMRSPPWTKILSLLGRDAEVIFSSLLLDCGLFKKVAGGSGNYLQLSGVPISELAQLPRIPGRKTDNPNAKGSTASDIRFIRHRILYARPSLNAMGKVKIGLHHTHVLQRIPDAKQRHQAAHLMKYIFPRQFGLHNVFTSEVDRDETTQRYKDYTFREEGISQQKKKSPGWIPRRLRGQALEMVQKIYRNNRSCSYSQLLRHYCPVVTNVPDMPCEASVLASSPDSHQIVTQARSSGIQHQKVDVYRASDDHETSFLPHATSAVRVSAFCRNVVKRLLPADALGTGVDGQHNWAKLSKAADDFVHMRRFETMSLHQALQGIRLGSISWLSSVATEKDKMARSEFTKLTEILQEFMYYIFDGLLIPIIRAHFYVTESSSHRQRLFYFRQDVWRKLSEPSLAMLRLSMYAAMKPKEARVRLAEKSLGYSQLRLLPKEHGARPITNLKRRQLKSSVGKRILGQSINTQLAPLFHVLNFERGVDASPLGSALFSIGGIHHEITEFKAKIGPEARLYFAKVDIKSCFDSIPQARLLDVARQVITNDDYRTTRHVEMKTLNVRGLADQGIKWKFTGAARTMDDRAILSEASVAGLSSKKRNCVFADLGQYRKLSRRALLEILQSHIQDSIVKIGKRYMRQIDGIPQGSVLSSLLCSYFYGDFEKSELAFLDKGSSVLLRLIDDFLLITTDHGVARAFLNTMANRGAGYGIQVNTEKSLVNFDVSVNGHRLPRLNSGTSFPYCGLTIDTTTLQMSKDRKKKDIVVSNSLTVESGSRPGSGLRKKVLASLKMQMHALLLDLALNGRQQVMVTLIGNFFEAAMKMHQYIASLAKVSMPTTGLLKSLVEDLIIAGTKLCRVKNAETNAVKYISHAQMCWMASAAFEMALARKQSQYKHLLIWLRALRDSVQPKMNMQKAVLDQMLISSTAAFRDIVY